MLSHFLAALNHSLLAYIHEQNYVHLDIAARNLLMSNDGLLTVKISDFGHAQPMAPNDALAPCQQRLISTRWAALEVCICVYVFWMPQIQ